MTQNNHNDDACSICGTTEAQREAEQARQTELYSLLCDTIERAWQRWPVESYREDPLRHTSEYARAGANRIMSAIDKYMEESAHE